MGQCEHSDLKDNQCQHEGSHIFRYAPYGTAKPTRMYALWCTLHYNRLLAGTEPKTYIITELCEDDEHQHQPNNRFSLETAEGSA